MILETNPKSKQQKVTIFDIGSTVMFMFRKHHSKNEQNLE